MGRFPSQNVRHAYAAAALAACLSLTGVGCGPRSGGTASVRPVAKPGNVAAVRQESKPGTPAVSPIRFRDVSGTAGLDSVHMSGMDPTRYFATCSGSGAALLDFDGDGLLDIFCPTTRNLPLSTPDRSRGNALYRNLGGLRFENVTEKAGVTRRGFFHGATVGDVNNDGRPDLFLTGLKGNVLYINNGGGTFRDATPGSGVENGLWCTGAAFLDYDGDGVLDLYVTCYARWTDTDPQPFCGDVSKHVSIYCSPFSMTPERHFLYRGKGDGTFVETTESAGVLRHDGRGYGVVAADVNGDGKTDLYVANDGCPNFLFLNKGDGTFEDATESSGAATNESGEVQGSMGADVQDVDNDGRPELFVTNFRGQGCTLYLNHDGRNFQDVSARAGIVRDSLPFVGWGCALADLDNDGLVDIFVVNGEIDDNLRLLGQPVDFAQPALVWRNLGDRRFVRVDDPGPFFSKNHPARGAAFGDLDNDGDLDVVITQMDQAPAILSNESPPARWIRVDLKATRSNRSSIGATVEVTAGGRTQHRIRKGGDSYLSSNDPRPLVGLGTADRVDRVVVRWPSGARSEIAGPRPGQTLTVTEPASGGAAP